MTVWWVVVGCGGVVAVSLGGAGAPSVVAAGSPALSISNLPSGLVISYSLPTNSGVATIYESEQVAGGASSWTPLCTAPIARGTPTALVVSNLTSHPARFYRGDVSPMQIPAQMIWIKAGSFLMGSPQNEVGRTPAEDLQHPVTIQQGFWLDKFLVTQAEYGSVMQINPSAYLDPSCPVESVTWEMATNYCARLDARERAAGRVPPGYVYRLPTEAEWEYACRAGTTTAYSFGNDPAFLGIYGWGGPGGGGHEHPVGGLNPNPWGLYDMHGNVFEYCLEWYAAYPGGKPYRGDPCHILRGGSFYCPVDVLRSACRSHTMLPGETSNLVGFRVALGPRPPLDQLLAPGTAPAAQP